MTIGEKIKAARIEKGFTMVELGKLCGSTKNTIYKYETGIVTNIPLPKFNRICEVLDLDPAGILGWTDDPTEACTIPDPNDPVVSIYNQLNSKGKTEYVRYGKYLVSQDEYRADE